MAVIRVGGFQGEIPRIHPRLLPEGNAQIALNCRLDSGAIESVNDTTVLQAIVTANPISLHRYASNIWLEASIDRSWVKYPVANDIYGRLIYNTNLGDLRVTDAATVGVGGAIAAYTKLEVPIPTQGFSAVLVGTADDDDEVPETRYYVCTFVNNYGAEGPPSPPSNEVEWRTGQTVTLSSLSAVPAGAYNITHRRIYRLNTGSTGETNYQFVTEVAVTQAQKTISSVALANPVTVVTDTNHNLLNGQEVVFTNLGVSAITASVTQISKFNPARVTAAAHGLSTGWTVVMRNLGSGNGMDELNEVRNVITVVDSDRFDLDGLDSTAFVTYVSGGTVARVFGSDELNNVSYFISVVDDTTIALDGVDGTGYKAYVEAGILKQVAGNSYTDGVPSANLAEVLPTLNYDPPSAAVYGVREHPAGFLVGFFGNTIVFSEPGAPHAFPIEYRLVTNHDIIGLGVFGNTIVVTTKGWPYLLIGSDPSAMSMVELEIEQACATSRGIVDFGAAIAYPSPDGLILIASSGATNISSGIFTRDQWQELVPSSFVAFNWEQKYLCFYDDTVTQRAFIIDPFNPGGGVRYISKYALGGYKDIEEDILYLIIGSNIEQWDQSATPIQYTWKSKPVYTPRAVNMAAAKVIADDYPVTVEFYVDDVKRYTKVVVALDAFRLPGGFKGEKFEVILKATKRVSEVIMATTMGELSVTV